VKETSAESAFIDVFFATRGVTPEWTRRGSWRLWRTGEIMNSGVERCWICNAPADSPEHRFKKADLVRAYGKGPYRGPSAPVHVRNGVLSPIQGPSSSKVKYEPSLCPACNTAGTQPFDNAYDRAIEWIMANEPEVLRRRLLSFEEIYGPSYAEHQRSF
jgi:hypothetical protein